MTGDPSETWVKDEIRSRNWAIATTLALVGLRDRELRQLNLNDVNTNQGKLTAARRSDDIEEPRLKEQNAKTYDRIVRLLYIVSERIEEYLYDHHSDAAELTGSNFLFSSDGPVSRGQPISKKVVYDAARQLGHHLNVPGPHPHSLRSAWIENLVDRAMGTTKPNILHYVCPKG